MSRYIWLWALELHLDTELSYCQKYHHFFNICLGQNNLYFGILPGRALLGNGLLGHAHLVHSHHGNALLGQVIRHVLGKVVR